MNTQSPLTEVAKEFGTVIDNLVLDRGILRSRWGLEPYHNKESGKALQWTADIRGSASNNVPITDRSTAAQANNGWHDPDGTVDYKNSLVGGPGTTTVAEGNRLYIVMGDPAADANVDAYNDLYLIGFSVTVDHGTVPSGWTVAAEVDVEYSTDGVNYTNLGGGGSHNALRTTAGTTTNNYSFQISVSGSPTQVRFRLQLRLVVQAPSGSASASVSAGAASTWQTSAVVSTPDRLPMRWSEDKIQIYEDVADAVSDWTDRYTFPASQKNTDNLLPSYVVWNDSVISTDIGDTPQIGAGVRIGSKGLVSTLLASPHTTTILTHSPRAAQIFVLGNRVCAVRTNEWSATTDPWVSGGITNLARVRWSVKNNSNDWDGLGSGWEDLQVSAGSMDEAMAGVAVTDETGIVVSEKTIRRMDVTGFFDAPFKFTLLDEELGTLSRYTIKGVPGGVIFLGYDDVYIVTLGGAQRIGTVALRDSIAAITNPRLAVGYMDRYNARYIVSFKENGTQVNWQYGFLDKGWTRLKIPFEIVAIDTAFYNVAGAAFFGAYFTQKLSDGYSVRENPTYSRDVNAVAAAVDSEIEARTGMVVVRDALHEVQLIQIQLLYEAAEAQTLSLEYSTDGGHNWIAYGQISVLITTRPTVQRVVRPVVADMMQVRVKSSTLGKLRIISLHVYAIEGAMVAP